MRLKDSFGNILEIGDIVAFSHKNELARGLVFKIDVPYVSMYPVNSQCDNADFTVKRKRIGWNVIKATHLKFKQ
jgi:hypothetical protein